MLATSAAGVVWLVVGVSLGAAVTCLAVAIWFTLDDRNATSPAREALGAQGEQLKARALGASEDLVDFSGIAQLADALGKVRPPVQLFVMALAFTAIAMATAVAGIAAG